MADPYEAFKWLREFDYSVDWFDEHGKKLLVHLGSGPAYRSQTIDALDAALEHADELTAALRNLRRMVADG